MTIPAPPSSPEPASDPDAARSPGPVPSRDRDGWWRTNRLPLLALLVLVPVVGIGVGWNEWFAYYGYGTRKVNAVMAADDGTTELNGATWGPVRSGEIADVSGMDMPQGTRLLAAVIPVAPDGAAVECAAPVLVQQSTGREWTPMRSEIGIPFNDDEPSTCISDLADEDDPDSAQPYSLVVAFVVPDDVEGPFWVEVDPVGDDRFVRFSIDP